MKKLARDMLGTAYDIAQCAHEGQTDKAGEPYILHPTRVAAAVRHHGIEYRLAGLLHDVVEDSDINLRDLALAGIPPRVVTAVDALTHRPGEPREKYYQRVKANRIALAVKRADIEDNLDPDRLAALDYDTAQRLVEKYEEALRVLDS